MDNIETKPLVRVRPLIMLTGFLGAGKTTLLRNTLDALAEHKILADVILNDRENANLDCESLRDHAASVIPLAGSCVCCESLDELTELLLKAAGTGHEALFLELNGTSDPLPLQESFTLLESRFLLRPRWQVCVIDARSFRNRKYHNKLEELQLETASHYHISHKSDLNYKQQLDIAKEIRSINPKASEIDHTQLAKNLAQTLANSHRFAPAPSAPSSSNTPLDNFNISAPKKEHTHHHLAHEFTGCQIVLPEPLPEKDIINWLTNLPEDVIRAKALTRTIERPDTRLLFERVGKVVSPRPYTVAIRDNVPSSAILIGADLSPDELIKITHEQLNPNCTLTK